MIKNLNIKEMKWLIPALAFLVIVESVFIVNQLNKGFDYSIQLRRNVVEDQSSAVMSIEGERQLDVDQVHRANVVLTALNDINLDGVDIYLKYDPEMIDIIGVAPSDDFSFVGRNWVEPENKRIIVTLVEPEMPSGVYFEAGSRTNLAVVEFVPLVPGQTKFEIYTPAEAEGTVLAGGGREFEFTKKDLVYEIK